jgi:hypothetical protein
VGLHVGYTRVVGARSHRPPAYQYEDGFFLAAAWSPLLKPEDADEPRAARVVEQMSDGGPYPLSDRSVRENQRWEEGGLVDRLQRAYGDSLAANHAAKRMCLRALRRDPLGVVRLTWQTYADYWRSSSDRIHAQLIVDQGADHPLPPSFVRELETKFGLRAAENSHAIMTPGRRYYLAGKSWYYFLLTSPLAGLFSVLLCRPASRTGAAFVFFFSTFLLVTTCMTSASIVFRYLHPFSFTGLMALGVIADSVWRRPVKATPTG